MPTGLAAKTRTSLPLEKKALRSWNRYQFSDWREIWRPESQLEYEHAVAQAGEIGCLTTLHLPKSVQGLQVPYTKWIERGEAWLDSKTACSVASG
jgi:hypothetical protein